MHEPDDAEISSSTSEEEPHDEAAIPLSITQHEEILQRMVEEEKERMVKKNNKR